MLNAENSLESTGSLAPAGKYSDTVLIVQAVLLLCLTPEMRVCHSSLAGEAEDSPGRTVGVCCHSLSPMCDLKAVLLSFPHFVLGSVAHWGHVCWGLRGAERGAGKRGRRRSAKLGSGMAR